MRFFVRKRRQTPTVIIVALIDVLIVLLIFLMVTTTFKQQPALKLSLPESTHATKSGANEQAPLIVSIDEKGGLRLGDDARPVTIEQLTSALQLQATMKPELKIAISSDKNAPVGQFVKVIDAAKEANITDIKAFMKEAAKP